MNAVLSRLFVRVLALCLLVAPLARGQEESQAAAEDVPLYSQAELDQMLAPIALYPDSLLSQLLMAATYPLEVVEAARWSRAHPDLKGEEAVREADGQSWDPSVKSMVAFPDILRRMDEDLEWTQNLGDAFLAQQEQVMDTVQALRKRAEEAGNLQSNDRVQIVHEDREIIVRDYRPDVVYVPWYDPWRVYGPWWWPAYRPVYWDPWPGYYGSGFFYWGPTIVIGHGFYYGHCDWRARQIRVVPAPPFYYRRPVPVHNVWVHEYRHRRGVPYRGQEVHQRYAEKYARPPRLGHPPYTGKGPDGRDRPTGYRGDDAPREPGSVQSPGERPRTTPDGSPARPRDRDTRPGDVGGIPSTGAPVTSGPRRPDAATPQRGGRHEDTPATPRSQPSVTPLEPVETPREPSVPPRQVTPAQPRHETPSQPRYEVPSQPRQQTPSRPDVPRSSAPREPRSQPQVERPVDVPSSYPSSRPDATPRSSYSGSGPTRSPGSSRPSYPSASQPAYPSPPQPSYQSVPPPSYSAPAPASPRYESRPQRSEPSRAPRAERVPQQQSRNESREPRQQARNESREPRQQARNESRAPRGEQKRQQRIAQR